MSPASIQHEAENANSLAKFSFLVGERVPTLFAAFREVERINCVITQSQFFLSGASFADGDFSNNHAPE